MSRLESVVCPWVGCGGTIREASANLEYSRGWVCDTCGEFFASPEGYQTKLENENEWAEAWIRWSEEKDQEGVEPEPVKPDRLSVEEEVVEVVDTVVDEEQQAEQVTAIP